MKTEINNEYLISSFGDAMLDRGFTSIPNTLIYYRRRLGLTASEFEFIIAIISLSWKKQKEIRDKDINPTAKHYYRQRKSLMLKGYLTFSTRYIYKDNKFCGTGTIYNLSGLKKAIGLLVEEDRALKNMDAPVEQKYDEPSLFGEDVNIEPLQPRKLIKKEKTEEDKKEDENKKEFLEKYNILHKELLGFEINYRVRTTYKKYLLKAFENRINNNIDEALEIAKLNFQKLALNKKESLKLQDLVKYALCTKNENHQNKSSTVKSIENKESENKEKYLIPKGLDKLNYLLDKIEEGGDIDEVYSQLCV